jgi:hypothetical protein
VQPAQQHGLRMPPFIFEIAFLILIPLVSAFFPEITQQIHSLRAKGVISSHSVRTLGTEETASRKSSGIVCTVLEETFLVFIGINNYIKKNSMTFTSVDASTISP